MIDHPTQHCHQGPASGRIAWQGHLGLGGSRTHLAHQISQADDRWPGCSGRQHQGQERVLVRGEIPAGGGLQRPPGRDSSGLEEPGGIGVDV